MINLKNLKKLKKEQNNEDKLKEIQLKNEIEKTRARIESLGDKLFNFKEVKQYIRENRIDLIEDDFFKKSSFSLPSDPGFKYKWGVRWDEERNCFRAPDRVEAQKNLPNEYRFYLYFDEEHKFKGFEYEIHCGELITIKNFNDRNIKEINSILDATEKYIDEYEKVVNKTLIKYGIDISEPEEDYEP